MAKSDRALIVLLLLACAASAQTLSTGRTVRHHHVQEASIAPEVARAEAALEKKDYAAAEQDLQAALEKHPNDYRAWFDLGFVYTATGRDAQAIDAYRKSVAAKPEIFESNLNLGLMLARTGNPEAEEYLRAATGLKPSAKPPEGLYRAWVSLGQVLETRDSKQAAAAFEKAAQLKPNEAEPHLFAAAAAEKSADMAAAERQYQAALECDPKSAGAISGLANLYLTTGRLPQAEAALRKYIALAPQSAPAHLMLGRVLVAQGKAPEAEPVFETALRLSPGDPRAEAELGALYAMDREFAKAEQHFRAALQKQPADAELRHRLGTALLQQKKFPEAQKELLAAVNLKPDYGIAYGDLALAASENKDYALAIKALEARARTLPDTPATYFLRATAYDHLQDYKQAAANYHQFLLAANGRFPDQEWQARHRLIAIEPRKK